MNRYRQLLPCLCKHSVWERVKKGKGCTTQKSKFCCFCFGYYTLHKRWVSEIVLQHIKCGKKYEDAAKMVQKAASGKMEKPQKPGRVGRFFFTKLSGWEWTEARIKIVTPYSPFSISTYSDRLITVCHSVFRLSTW